MYNLKKTLFLYLTPRQKSQLFAHISALVKKNMELEIDEILGKFLDDEIYYDKLGSPHFEFVIENIENDEFLKELKMFIKASKYHFEYLAKQEPYIDKQKEFLKKQNIEVAFATDEEITIIDLVSLCAEKLGTKAEIIFNGYRESDPERRVLNTEKIRTRTNWKPSVTLEEGIMQCVTEMNK